jgi:hypothetical protein
MSESETAAAGRREFLQTVVAAPAGQPFGYVSLPDAAHTMRRADPARFAQV